jgi:peptidyl-prolyl cis-trans isomerase SurA
VNVNRIFAFLLVVGGVWAGAEVVKLDSIIAVCNDDVVLESELRERVTAVYQRLQGEGVTNMPAPDALTSQLMERLIVECIQLQMANQRGIVIDDETLTETVNGFAQQNNMSIDEFRLALDNSGVTYREFREGIRREMQLSQVQQLMVSRRVTITDKDLDDLIASPFFQEMISDEYRVGHILIAVENDASQVTIAAAGRAAADIVAELRAGADFAQMAIERSASSTALEGGDLGWRRAAELPSLFDERIIALAPGETADPIQNSLGFHIVQLLEQRGVSRERKEQSLVRHILVKSSAIRSFSQTRALVQKLYNRIGAGEDFAMLAKEYSEDPGSALVGGDLGWSDGSDVVSEFGDVMAKLKIGALSEPFKTTHGWHILQVMDRRNEDISEEARRGKAAQLLHSRRFEEELQVWLQEIRDEAYVQLRQTTGD